MTTQYRTATRPVTLAEFAALPEYPRYELIQGVLVEKMVASREHEVTVIRTGSSVNSHVEGYDLGEVYGSNRAFVTGPASPATSRLPDISFVSNARLNRPDWYGMLYDGAPDLAVEVISRGNSLREIAQKVAEYLNAGGKAVWVIDPIGRTLTVHTPDAPPQVLTDGDMVDGAGYLPGFLRPVADLLPRRRS